MKETDITGDKFDFIDFSEENIFFGSFSERETFKVNVWGLTFMRELGITEIDCYLPAVSEVLFENVAYICLDYGIYTDRQCQEFVKSITGDSTDLRLELGKKENVDGYTKYIFGGVLGRYLGYGEITLYCKGTVKLTYDEIAFIPVGEYCLNPKKYRMQ